MRGFLYSVLLAFLRLVTRVFFRTIEVVGAEHVPKSGAVIFVGNHPNSLIDPVLITTTCRRRVRFAAKDTLFKLPFLRPFLWVMGSVPIRRRMDHSKEGDPAVAAVDNNEAFSELFKVLKDGEAFGIFPEGISHAMSELAPLKTGAARIALGAAAQGISLCIVPSGLNFRKRDRMRGRVLVQYGEPLTISPALLELYATDPREAARRLTAQIDQALRAQTINAKDFEVLRVLDGVRRLYIPEGHALALSEQTELLRRLVNGWEQLQNEKPIADLYKDTATYLAALDALGFSDEELTQGLSRTSAALRVLGHATLLGVYVPAAIPGIVLHTPVLGLAIAAGNFTERTDVLATVKIMITAMGTMLTYCLIVAWVFHSQPFPTDVIVAPVVMGLLLLSGWATIRVLERQAAIRSGVSTLFRLLNLQRELERLRAERQSLRARLLQVIDQYAPATTERVIDRDEHGLHADDVL